jgi:hypothetical protein
MNIVKHPSAWIVPVALHVLAPASADEQVNVQLAARTAPHFRVRYGACQRVGSAVAWSSLLP